MNQSPSLRLLSHHTFQIMVVPVGLDIGTGYAKVSGGGKTAMFPTVYALAHSGAVSVMKDMDVRSDGGSRILERVGNDAAKLSKRYEWVLLRPVKYGAPYDRRGYGLVARHAMDAIGVDPKNAAICAGITYDAREHRSRVRNIILGMNPVACAVIPQAVGTLVACGKETGTVINIGHGTTEIISVDANGVNGISVPKASDFVLSQIVQSSRNKVSYVNHEKIFVENKTVIGKLVGLLAAGISDEVGRIGVPEEIILAGGGSLIPGMQKALSAAIGCKITSVHDPLMSNAVGFEIKAASLVESMKKGIKGQTPGKQ